MDCIAIVVLTTDIPGKKQSTIYAVGVIYADAFCSNTLPELHVINMIYSQLNELWLFVPHTIGTFVYCLELKAKVAPVSKMQLLTRSLIYVQVDNVGQEEMSFYQWPCCCCFIPTRGICPRMMSLSLFDTDHHIYIYVSVQALSYRSGHHSTSDDSSRWVIVRNVYNFFACP